MSCSMEMLRVIGNHGQEETWERKTRRMVRSDEPLMEGRKPC